MPMEAGVSSLECLMKRLSGGGEVYGSATEVFGRGTTHQAPRSVPQCLCGSFLRLQNTRIGISAGAVNSRFSSSSTLHSVIDMPFISSDVQYSPT